MKVVTKHIEEAIDLIQALQEEQIFKIDLPDSVIDGIEGTLRKKDNYYEFVFSDLDRSMDWSTSFTNLTLKNKEFNFHIPVFYLTSISAEIAENTIKRVLTTSINKLGSLNFDEKKVSYFRLIIPITKKINFDRNKIKLSEFSSEKYTINSNCIKCVIQGIDFEIYQHEGEKNDEYFFIECNSPINYQKFSDISFAITLAFGFIIGIAPLSQGYFFAYEHPELSEIHSFCFHNLIDTIKYRYPPINTNAYSFEELINNEQLKEKYYKILKPLSQNLFEKLCNTAYENEEFRNCLQLILEGSALNTTAMVICYYVVLEKLTNVIVAKRITRNYQLRPIKDKILADEFRKSLLTVLENYKSQIKALYPDNLLETKEVIDNIEKQINDINKLTNKNRLKYVFETLNISLNPQDEEIISWRDYFLHGNESHSKIHLTDDKYRNIFYISLKLNTLLSAIILKYIGYEGWIINYPKIYEQSTRVPLNEEYYWNISHASTISTNDFEESDDLIQVLQTYADKFRKGFGLLIAKDKSINVSYSLTQTYGVCLYFSFLSNSESKTPITPENMPITNLMEENNSIENSAINTPNRKVIFEQEGFYIIKNNSPELWSEKEAINDSRELLGFFLQSLPTQSELVNE